MIDIQNKVREHGAKLRQGIPPAELSDRLVIAQKMNGMLQGKRGISEIDVVDPSWVLESIEKKRRQPLHKRYVSLRCRSIELELTLSRMSTAS